MGIDINNQGLYLNDAIKKILEEMDTLMVNNEILHKEEINLDEALGKVSMEEILSEEDMPGYRSSDKISSIETFPSASSKLISSLCKIALFTIKVSISSKIFLIASFK